MVRHGGETFPQNRCECEIEFRNCPADPVSAGSIKQLYVLKYGCFLLLRRFHYVY